MAERGVTVAVNTSSNPANALRRGARLPLRAARPAIRLRPRRLRARRRPRTTSGTLRLARRLHDGTGLEPALPPGRLFDAACRHGFRCIDGSDDYGAIAPGARADLVVLDYAALCEDFLTPEHDEVDVLLTRANLAARTRPRGRRASGRRPRGPARGSTCRTRKREFMESRRAGRPPSIPGNGPATGDGASPSAPTTQAGTTLEGRRSR